MGSSANALFMRKELDFLGHVTSGEGISVDRSKIGVDKGCELVRPVSDGSSDPIVVLLLQYSTSIGLRDICLYRPKAISELPWSV
jgi:hypothetical protein